MRVLLDNNLPVAMKYVIPTHDVVTTGEMGWRNKKNGELLTLADQQFDVLITNDRNMPYQQNLSRLYSLAVIVLVTPDNREQTLLSLISEVQAAIPNAKRLTFTQIVHPNYRRK